MPRYIDAEELELEYYGLSIHGTMAVKSVLPVFAELLKKQPAADVVEVVRCKDCDVPHNKWTGCPHLNGLIPPPNFYCAKGIRKSQKEGDVE